MTAPPEPTPPPPVTRPGRWRRRFTLLLFVLAALAAAGWWYRVTRPDYRLARGRDAIRVGDEWSVRRYADRLESSGHTDHAHLLRGEALHAAGQPAEALVAFNRIDPNGPFRLRVAALAGRCLLELGELGEAHRVFAIVVAESPDDVDGHRGLAAIEYDLGRLEAALDHLRRVGELDAADSRQHRLIGLIHKDMDRVEPAETAYREALRRRPSPAIDRQIRLELADVLARGRKFAEGLEVLGDILPGPTTEDPNAAVVRAECLRGLGRSREAAELLDGARSADSGAAHHRLRGQLDQDLRRPAEALLSFERAVARDPFDYQARYLLGQAYAAAGRPDEAAKEFARVETLKKDLDRITDLTHEAMAHPRDAGVRLRLAKVCDDLGKPKLAAMWRRAAQAAPGS